MSLQSIVKLRTQIVYLIVPNKIKTQLLWTLYNHRVLSAATELLSKLCSPSPLLRISFHFTYLFIHFLDSSPCCFALETANFFPFLGYISDCWIGNFTLFWIRCWYPLTPEDRILFPQKSYCFLYSISRHVLPHIRPYI